MARTTQLNWEVPAESWMQFLTIIEDVDELEPFYIRKWLESVMEEMIDRDEFAKVEELVEEVRDTVSCSCDRFSDVGYSISVDEEGEMVEVSASVNTDLLNEFRSVVREQTDYRMGVALAYSIERKIVNGRLQRVLDKLQQLREAFTDDDPAETYDPDEQDIHYNDVNMSDLDGRSRKKKRYEVCQLLDPDPDEALHVTEIHSAITSIAGETTIQRYFGPVLETLNFIEHPTKPDQYVHVSRYKDLNSRTTSTDSDEPPADLYEITQQGFDDLDREGRLTKIRIALARKAARKGRRLYKTDYTFIRDEVFDDHRPSKGYANNAMEDVADAPGYTLKTDHGKQIQVNHSTIDLDISELLAWERDHQGLCKERTPDPGQTTLDDQSEPEPEREHELEPDPVEASSDTEALEDVEEEADAFWTQYDQAEVENPTATDGGVEL